MISVPGYTVEEKLHAGTRVNVYRARREADGQSAVLKIPAALPPTSAQRAQFRREYELTRSLRLPGVIRVHALHEDVGGLALILEDFNAISLEARGLAGQLPLSLFLRMALELVEILGQLHGWQLLHGHISPANVLVNLDTNQLKLTDFSLALSWEQTSVNPDSEPRSPNTSGAIPPATALPMGKLAYISPEQTGRMQRGVDYRTDFYSLGITLYRLLSGHLPYQAASPLEWIHRHLAASPLSLEKIRPDVPRMLNEILFKLLAKTPEERYQSSYGLQADLRACLEQWEKYGDIWPFLPASQDSQVWLELPRRLYGRNRELQTLYTLFDRVGFGKGELLLISGYAGIGKSALIQAWEQEVAMNGGRFIGGKFDQYQRDLPYSALIQAFSKLADQLLSEDEDRLQQWRQDLLNRLGDNSALLCHLVPRLALVLKPPTAPPEISIEKARNHFHLMFQGFVEFFARPEQPLVLFLDDLQWADRSSLGLLRNLLKQGCPNLLLIVAYREPEVEAENTQSLQTLLTGFEQTATRVTRIQLEALGLLHINRLLADTFERGLEETQNLAALVLSKTDGNPFFVREFLKSLYTEKLIYFVPPGEHPSAHSGWQWDMEKLQARQITDNVSELMSSKLNSLPPASRELVQLAACLGSQFEVSTLSLLYGRPLREVMRMLWDIVAKGLVLSSTGRPRVSLLQKTDREPQHGLIYHFAHDRIRQAAYALIPETEKAAWHYRVGCQLWEHLPASEHEDKLLDIVGHLNRGRDCLETSQERKFLAELNFRAGKQTRTTGAYESSLGYFLLALGLLGEAAWHDHYSLTLDLHLSAMEVAYLNADLTRCRDLGENVLRQAREHLDKVLAHELMILALVAGDQLLPALDMALKVLRELGQEFPARPGKLSILREYFKTRWYLRFFSIKRLAERPEMSDPRLRAATRIMAQASSACYLVAPTLLPLLLFRMAQLTARHGNHPFAGHAYGGYALLLSGIFRKPGEAYKLGKLAEELCQRPGARKLEARILSTLHSGVVPWSRPIAETLSPLLRAHHSGLKHGDLEYAARALHSRGFHLYLMGNRLDELAVTLREYSRGMRRLGQHNVLTMNEIFRQAVLNLLETPEQPDCLEGEAYRESTQLSLLEKERSQGNLFLIYFYKMWLAYVFDLYVQAETHAREAEKYLDAMLGSPLVALFYLYSGLTDAARLAGLGGRARHQALKRLRLALKHLKRWAGDCAANYQHKYLLLWAESRRAEGDARPLADIYENAARLAHQQNFLQDEALIHERLAEYYQCKNKLIPAQAHLNQARQCYLNWGAWGKVDYLDTRLNNSPVHSETSQFTPGEGLDKVDLHTVFEAMSTISGEIELPALLRKLMLTALRNAGAEEGVLLLKQKGEWVIQAACRPGQEYCEVMRAQPMVDDNQESAVPVSLINFVIHSQEVRVLEDAGYRGEFIHDPYIQARQCRSVLCLPLTNQGQLQGILYLENNLASGVFTPTRLEVLRLLSTQMAVALENARLYADTTALNRELQAQMEERLQAAIALRESEERFRVIAETIPVPLLITRPNDGDILYINHRLREIQDAASENLLGRQAREFYPCPEERRLLLNKLQYQGRVHNYELRLRLGGEIRWVAMFMESIHYNHEPAILTALYDITDRKLAEEELNRLTQQLSEANQRLEKYSAELELKVSERTAELEQQKEEAVRANRAKSMFLAAASHDLRQPLYALTLYVGVLERSLKDAEDLKTLEKVQKSLDSMNGLFESLLDISRLDGGTVKPELRYFELWTLLATLENDFGGLAADKQLNLEMTGCRELTVYSDPILLEQILRNLLSNALRYTPEGGRVWLECRNRDQGLEISVNDTGMGIPPTQQQDIFLEFHQLHNPERDRRKGLGLGLAIVKRLVDLLGYELCLDSEPGKGSRFILSLPPSRPDRSDKALETPPMVIHPGENSRILLIEDEADVLLATQVFLQSNGFRVLAVTSAEQALRGLHQQQFQPDLIISDYRLRENRTGVEALRAVRTFLDRKIPGIIITGDTRLLPMEEIRQNACELLYKPLTPERLLREILESLPERNASNDGGHEN